MSEENIESQACRNNLKEGETARTPTVHHHNRPRPRNSINLILLHEIDKLLRAILQHLPMSPKPHNLRRALKRIEKNRDPSISGLLQVRERFYAGTGEIDVPECLGVDDAEVWPAFGGDVDVACGREGRGGDPEDFLFKDPGYEGLGDGFIEGAHGG